MIRRAIVAFLLAPLIGVLACWILFLLFDVPKDAIKAPLYFLIFYMPFLAVPIYAVSWAVGVPLYVVLHRFNRVRTEYLAATFALVGLLIMVGLLLRGHWHQQNPALVFLLIMPLTGAVTGATLGRLLTPPSDRGADS